MHKIFTVVVLALSLACGSSFSEGRTTVRGTGTAAEWRLRVENNHWLNAKVYLIPAYSSYGPRVINVPGLSEGAVDIPLRVGTFRLR